MQEVKRLQRWEDNASSTSMHSHRTPLQAFSDLIHGQSLYLHVVHQTPYFLDLVALHLLNTCSRRGEVRYTYHCLFLIR